jgi:hypothetical protein
MNTQGGGGGRGKEGREGHSEWYTFFSFPPCKAHVHVLVDGVDGARQGCPRAIGRPVCANGSSPRRAGAAAGRVGHTRGRAEPARGAQRAATGAREAVPPRTADGRGGVGGPGWAREARAAHTGAHASDGGPHRGPRPCWARGGDGDVGSRALGGGVRGEAKGDRGCTRGAGVHRGHVWAGPSTSPQASPVPGSAPQQPGTLLSTTKCTAWITARVWDPPTHHHR